MPIKLELESTLFPNEKLTFFQSNSKEISAKRRFDNLSNNNNNTRKGEWFAHTWLSTRGRSNPRNIEDLVDLIYLAINRAGQKKKKKHFFDTRCSNEWNTSSFRTALAHTHTRGLYSEYEYNGVGGLWGGEGGRGLCELAAWYHRSTGNETAPDQEELICPQCSAYSPFCP